MSTKEKDLNIINITYDKIPEESKERIDFLYDIIPEVNENELTLIDFNYFNMELILEIVRTMKTLKQFKKGDIYNYISFTRFVDGDIKIGCDWCSICNGGMEIFYDTILEISNDENKISKLKTPLLLEEWLDLYEPFFIEHKHYSNLICEDIYLNPILNKIKDYKEKDNILLNILPILRMLNAVKQIEQRWCPFKHMKKLNFNRDYYFYNSHDPKDVKLAIKDLKRNGKITNGKIKDNDNSYIKGITIFDDFMNYIENIITK